jgi:multimeric flavodoxin WrbA
MLIVVKIEDKENKSHPRIDSVLTAALDGREYTLMNNLDDFAKWCEKPVSEKQGTALLFALPWPDSGVSLAYSQWLNIVLSHPNCLAGCTGAVLIDGPSEFFTKKVGREVIFVANQAGCSFPGKSLVEATGSLANFNILAQIQGLDNLEAYKKSATNLVDKLVKFNPYPPKKQKPYILVVHASIYQTSNTLLLWDLVKKALNGRADIEEVSLRNGEIIDCRGCNYETCLHFGENGRCFYGGVIVDKAYPAIKRCDAIVLLCPNYNDSLSANLTAFINRLTALFRKDFATFAAKRFYALVVSGYSGGDIVAEQVIDALNCNKNFMLPGNFALIETANAPKSILACHNIEAKAAALAERILK